MMSALADWYPGHRALEFCVIVAAAVSLVSFTEWGVSWLLNRRPAARHCALLSALIASLASPFLAFAFVASGRSFVNVPLLLAQDSSVPTPGMPKEMEISRDVPPSRGPMPVLSEPAQPTAPESVVPGHRAAPAVAEQLTPRNPVVEEPKPQTVEPVIGRADPFRSMAVAVLLMWLCGTVVVILGVTRSWIFLQRLRRSVQPISDASQLRTVEKARRLLSARHSPTVGVSRLARAPLATGVFRPVVVLPYELPAAINEDQLRDILMHEIAHIERRDNLVVLLQVVAKAIFWPIPFIHLLNRELETAREEICDNHVLVCRDAVSYGETLLRVAQLTCCGAMPSGTVGILHWRGKLEDRISGLIHKGRNTMTRMHPLMALGVLALFLSVSALLCGTSIVAAQQPKVGTSIVVAEQPKADDTLKAESTDKDSPTVSIHYLDGLSAESRDTPQDIRFLHYGCPLSLLLTNTTKNEIHLWKPNCPEGDDAIRLEFKRDADSKEIGTARMANIYTGGSGRPRTMKLVPGDSLIYRVDLSSYWSLPFVLQPGAQANLLVRAVYESKPIAAKKSPLAPDTDTVWNGRIETKWERVQIVNLTDSEAPKGHRGANLLAPESSGSSLIFDSRIGHPWDQAREIFYTHRFPTGEVFEHPHAFAPPWKEFVQFVHDAAFHEQVLARLEAVEKLPPAQMEEQPVARRLIFLRDLWPVFDGLYQALVNVPGDKEATAKAVSRRDELLRRVAGLMRRLELTEDEVGALPSAFQLVGEKKLYPKSFDPSSPSEPFFPAELLDKDGPWVSFSQEEEPSAGGTAHTSFVKYRSMFTLHLQAPDGRDGGVKFLQDWTRSEGQLLVPPGTTTALLRRALVPTRSGKLLVSPFVESLQLRAVAPEKDHRFKFTLDRAEFLAGKLGLKPLGKDDPVDTSSFESILLPHRMALEPSKTEHPSESLIALRYKTLKEIPSSMDRCANCHSFRNQLFGSSGPVKVAFLQPDPDKAAATVIQKKEASEEWKSYLRLRTAQAK